MLLAPISPVDVFNIRGVNGPQSFPGTPGLEGVGEVVAVGSSVSGFKSKDLVIPLNPKNGELEILAKVAASCNPLWLFCKPLLFPPSSLFVFISFLFDFVFLASVVFKYGY
jgi:hypothetical protein